LTCGSTYSPNMNSHVKPTSTFQHPPNYNWLVRKEFKATQYYKILHIEKTTSMRSCTDFQQPSHFWGSSESHRQAQLPHSLIVFAHKETLILWQHDSPHSTSGEAHPLLQQFGLYHCYLPQKSDPVYSGSSASTMAESVHISDWMDISILMCTKPQTQSPCTTWTWTFIHITVHSFTCTGSLHKNVYTNKVLVTATNRRGCHKSAV
jgi:hypothetical protein